MCNIKTGTIKNPLGNIELCDPNKLDLNNKKHDEILKRITRESSYKDSFIIFKEKSKGEPLAII